MNTLLKSFACLPRPLTVVIGLVLVGLIAAVDYSTGPYIGLGVFYLLPVMLVAWATASMPCGFIIAAAAFATGPAEAVLADSADVPLSVAAWNGAVRFAVFAIFLLLMARMRDLMARLETQAMVDELTGLSNLRSLRELLTRELERSRRYRHSLSLAYIDLDGLKTVNDRCGHAAGSRMLVTFAAVAQASSRAVDTVARVGGDEFVVLLPETGADAAVLMVDRLSDAFVRATSGSGWPSTCSIGLASFEVMPADADAVLEAADTLMYQVKARGGNDIEAREFGPISAESPQACA